VPLVEVPHYYDPTWPTIEALRAIGGSGSIRDIDEKIAELTNLSEEQRTRLHGAGPQTEFEYRSAWARTRLKQLGAIENTARGVWALTEHGREATEAYA
jgi:restriction system protein